MHLIFLVSGFCRKDEPAHSQKTETFRESIIDDKLAKTQTDGIAAIAIYKAL
jgi:hypothetical protein